MEGEDLFAIESHEVQSLFSTDELSLFRERVRTELLPNLADVRWSWQSNCDSDRKADEHMEPLLESFESLKQEFADDTAIVSAIDRQIELARDWIAEKLGETLGTTRSPRQFGEMESLDFHVATPRSIFDDIDE